MCCCVLGDDPGLSLGNVQCKAHKWLSSVYADGLRITITIGGRLAVIGIYVASGGQYRVGLVLLTFLCCMSKIQTVSR